MKLKKQKLLLQVENGLLGLLKIFLYRWAYKFSGLPGLIVKVEDEKGDYSFDLKKPKKLLNFLISKADLAIILK